MIIILICCAFAALLLKGGYFVFRKYVFDIEEPYYDEVVDARWSVVLLNNGEKVSLAGVFIPWDKDMINYNPELEKNAGKILNGKTVKIELIERHRSDQVLTINMI